MRNDLFNDLCDANNLLEASARVMPEGPEQARLELVVAEIDAIIDAVVGLEKGLGGGAQEARAGQAEMFGGTREAEP